MQSGNVTNCNFTDNKVTADISYGGAVYFDGTGTVTNCNFKGNNAKQGGAIRMQTGNVTNCNFTDNQATTGLSYGGGAVYFDGTGTVTNCNFKGNTADHDGGAIRMQSGIVTNCIFVDNSANKEEAIYSVYWSPADTCIFKTSSDTTFNIFILPPTLGVDNFTSFYGSGEKVTFNLTTNIGSIPVPNGNISISVYFKNGTWVGNYSCLSGEGWIPDLRRIPTSQQNHNSNP